MKIYVVTPDPTAVEAVFTSKEAAFADPRVVYDWSEVWEFDGETGEIAEEACLNSHS